MVPPPSATLQELSSSTSSPVTFSHILNSTSSQSLSDNVWTKLRNPSDDLLFDFMLLGIYAVAILIVWNVPYLKHILYPFKLITVAFHEFGHALAGKCTGARIESISVDPNQGGVTKMRGGNQCCVLPAGYIGSSVFGSLLIFCGFDITASKVASVFVCLCLLATLYWADNWFTRCLTFVFILIFPLCWIFTPNGVALTYVVLFLGVMSAMYSLWDIVEDLITRKVNSSDAAVFSQRYGCSSYFWGVFWLLISFAFLAVAIFMALLVW